MSGDTKTPEVNRLTNILTKYHIHENGLDGALVEKRVFKNVVFEFEMVKHITTPTFNIMILPSGKKLWSQLQLPSICKTSQNTIIASMDLDFTNIKGTTNGSPFKLKMVLYDGLTEVFELIFPIDIYAYKTESWKKKSVGCVDLKYEFSRCKI